MFAWKIPKNEYFNNLQTNTMMQKKADSNILPALIF